MYFALFLALSILASSTVVIANVNIQYACPKNEVPLRNYKGKAVARKECLSLNGNSAPSYTFPKGKMVMALITDETSIPADSNCEHMMPTSVLGRVLNSPNGPCTKLAQAVSDADKQAIREKMWKIIDIVNYKPNLVYLQAEVDALKASVTSRFYEGMIKNPPVPVKFKKSDKESFSKEYTDLQAALKGVDDYIKATQSSSDEVARELDAKILELFPETTGRVVDLWGQLKAFAANDFA